MNSAKVSSASTYSADNDGSSIAAGLERARLMCSAWLLCIHRLRLLLEDSCHIEKPRPVLTSRMKFPQDEYSVHGFEVDAYLASLFAHNSARAEGRSYDRKC